MLGDEPWSIECADDYRVLVATAGGACFFFDGLTDSGFW